MKQDKGVLLRVHTLSPTVLRNDYRGKGLLTQKIKQLWTDLKLSRDFPLLKSRFS